MFHCRVCLLFSYLDMTSRGGRRSGRCLRLYQPFSILSPPAPLPLLAIIQRQQKSIADAYTFFLFLAACGQLPAWGLEGGLRIEQAFVHPKNPHPTPPCLTDSVSASEDKQHYNWYDCLTCLPAKLYELLLVYLSKRGRRLWKDDVTSERRFRIANPS